MSDDVELDRLRRENARLEEELVRARAQVHKLGSLISDLPVAAVVFQASDFRVELANGAYEALIGQRDVVGKTLAEIHPGVSAHSILGHLEEVLRQKVPRVRREHPLDLPGPHGTIERRFFTNTFQPLLDTAGDVCGVVATVTEVTQEVGARRAAAEAAARLRVILDELPVGVIVRDGNTGEPLLTNKATREILGVDVIAEGSTDLLQISAQHGGASLSEERPHRSVMRTGQPVRNKTLVARRPDSGAEIVLRSSAAAVMNHGGPPLVVSVFEDVTDEAALVAERERTSRFAETFIGVLGHDLKTPLQAILVGAALLEARGSLDPEVARRIGQIRSSASRMARMVDQLLDMTRVRLGGGIPIARSRTDLAAVVADVIEELSTAHPDVQLRSALPARLMGMWDGDRLAQVVSNLVGNAIEYGAAGRDVTVTGSLEQGPTFTLAVHNYGPAIPDDLVPFLFDPFRRGAGAASARTRGLGLGLYITREIVTAHGGAVQVTSSVAAGTRFTVTLPVLTSDAAN